MVNTTDRTATFMWLDGWTVCIIWWYNEVLHLLMLNLPVELKIDKQWQEVMRMIYIGYDNALTMMLRWNEIGRNRSGSECSSELLHGEQHSRSLQRTICRQYCDSRTCAVLHVCVNSAKPVTVSLSLQLEDSYSSQIQTRFVQGLCPLLKSFKDLAFYQ